MMPRLHWPGHVILAVGALRAVVRCSRVCRFRATHSWSMCACGPGIPRAL